MSDSDLDISESIQPLEDEDVARSLTDNTTFAIEGVLLPVLSALGVIGRSDCQPRLTSCNLLQQITRTRIHYIINQLSKYIDTASPY